MDLSNHLQCVLNYILENGSFPEKWGHSLRIAIHKRNDDICPITMDPIFGEIFKTIVDHRFSFINETFNKDDKYNRGFVKGSMPQDNSELMQSIYLDALPCP